MAFCLLDGANIRILIALDTRNTTNQYRLTQLFYQTIIITKSTRLSSRVVDLTPKLLSTISQQLTVLSCDASFESSLECYHSYYVDLVYYYSSVISSLLFLKVPQLAIQTSSCQPSSQSTSTLPPKTSYRRPVRSTTGEKIFNHTNSNNNYSILDSPTHFPYITTQKPDIIDIALLNISNKKYTISNFNDLNPDHNPIVITIDNSPTTCCHPPPYRNTNFGKYLTKK